MGFHSLLNWRTRRLLLSFALICIQIIAGLFALKNAQKPGAQLTRALQGNCGMDALWAAGSSSAQMMDVMGLCEGCSQTPVPSLVLALGGGVQLPTPG